MAIEKTLKEDVDELKKKVDDMKHHGERIASLEKNTERLMREDCRYKFVMFPKRAVKPAEVVPEGGVVLSLPDVVKPAGGASMMARKREVILHLKENFPDIHFERARATIDEKEGKVQTVFVRLDHPEDVEKVVLNAPAKPSLRYWIKFSRTPKQRKEDAQRQEKFKEKRLEEFTRRNNISKEELAHFVAGKKNA